MAASSLAGWRTFDFVIIGGLAALLVFGFLRAAATSPNAADQLLVLLPEGFMMDTGKGPRTYFYAAFPVVKATNARGNITLTLTPATGGRPTRVLLDGRFGKAKPLAQAILQSQQLFARQYAMPAQPWAQGQPPR